MITHKLIIPEEKNTMQNKLVKVAEKYLRLMRFFAEQIWISPTYPSVLTLAKFSHSKLKQVSKHKPAIVAFIVKIFSCVFVILLLVNILKLPSYWTALNTDRRFFSPAPLHRHDSKYNINLSYNSPDFTPSFLTS